MAQVFVIGIALFPNRTTGDKNFYFECFRSRHLPDEHEVHILSFTGRSGVTTKLQPHVWLHELSRPFHLREYDHHGARTGELSSFRHHHSLPWEYVERTSSLVSAASLIRGLRQRNKELVVHFLDNFGPAMSLLGKSLGARRITISARAVGWPYGSWRSRFVQATLGTLDRIGASSAACAGEFERAGISPSKLTVQRLGVDVSKIPQKRTRTNTVLWTGFIPHSGEKEFHRALSSAKSVPDVHNWEFIFTFKPEVWKKEYALYNSQNIRVEESKKPFLEYLRESDVLLSPLRDGSPLIPPLSWLEAMACGVPIITSKVTGAGELIEDDKEGFVQRTGEELRDTLRRALQSDPVTIGINARARVATSFTLSQAVEDLVRLWSKGCNDE